MNDSLQSKRPRLIYGNEAGAKTTFDSGVDKGITAEDDVAFQCGVVAGLLGFDLFDKSSLMDQAWVTKLHGLAARGISAEALRRYFTLIISGIVPHPVRGSVTTAAPEGVQRCLRVYQLPQILRYSQPRRKGFTTKFDEFAKRFTEPDFSIQTRMENARRILMANRAMYFSDEFCEVVVAIPDVGKVRAKISTRVRDAFESTDPSGRGRSGVVIRPGGNHTDWVVRLAEESEAPGRKRKLV